MFPLLFVWWFSDYKKDPYSKGDPCKTICCRNDLNPVNPTPGGCYDTKVPKCSLLVDITREFKWLWAQLWSGSCSLSRWQISTWLGTSGRRQWTGQRLRTDCRRSFGINSAAWATRVCRSSTTLPSSGCSRSSLSHEVCLWERQTEGERFCVSDAFWGGNDGSQRYNLMFRLCLSRLFTPWLFLF